MRVRKRAHRIAAGAIAMTMSWSVAAGAQPSPSGTPLDTPLPDPPPEAYGYTPDELIDTSMRRSWNEGRVRTFIATTLDVGWTYIRPRVSAGYGKPFASWAGVDANPLISGNGLGGYGGIRLALPRIDLRVGTRYFASFRREYLNKQESYNRLDLDSTLGDPARVLTFESELEASFPLGPGDVIGLGSISYVANVPEGQYVFEETLRVIVAPPWVWRARGGYVVRFGALGQHSIGVVTDVLNVPAREDSTTIRLGPIVRIQLSRRVEVRGTFVPTIKSPDHIGLIGGDFTELGFRYRWATE